MTLKPIYEELERRPKEVATGAVEPNRTERGQGELEEPFIVKKSVTFIAGILILFGLYLSSLYNYLLFHSLSEIFSIVVAWTIFILAWNSRRIMDNNYLLFIGIAFLFIGGLDLVHTLGYKGMEIFHGYGANLPTQLWIAARYMESLSLLIAPLFLTRRLKPDLALMIYALVTALVLGSVFYWHIFPTCFVEGVGLTPFKKISEYIISIILIGAITFLFQKRKEFDERVFRLLVAAMVVTIAAELAFTFYVSAYGFSNLVGHYFKIISFYLIYKAIIETGLTKPYDLLFRNLKQSEDALRESEERFKGLMEQSPVSVQMMDPDGKTFQVNRAWEELWGVTLEDLENYNFLQDEQLKSLGLMPYIEKGFSGEVSSIPPREYDAKSTLGKGVKRWVTARLFPVKDTMENIRSIVLMHEDVTARVLAEKTLRESEEKYRLLIENATDAIFIAQAEVLKFANPKAEEMTGYCAEELTKIPFVELIHSEDREMVIERHLKRLKGEELPSVYSFRILNRSGKELLVELNAVLINWEGKPATLNFMRDITVQRKLESQLQRTQKMEAIATLAGGVAHEFNNALTGIMGNIELLKIDLPEDERRDRYFKAMNGSGHRMSRLTDQLLAYAEGGKYQPKDLRLNDFVIETLPILKYDLSPEVRVETHFPKDISHIKADYAQMQMVLSAILANSNEAIKDEGLIKITAENEDVDQDFAKQHPGLKPGPYVCLTIEDNGKGMDEETRTEIFEPFFTTKFQGRGMGMAAVYGIVRNHDGWIYVESELGKGTTVQIYLPAIEIEVEKPRKAKAEVVTRTGTILMIEDEDVVIEVTQAMLEMLGYRVMVTKTGKDAIHIAETFDGQIDLALLDIKLPDMEGGKVYPLIMEARPNLKVIVFSGYSIDGPARKILDAGAQDFIQKPFSLAILSEKLEEVLGGE